jgi:hypothetical protein
MHPLKREYAKEVYNAVFEACSVMTGDKVTPIASVLKINANQAQDIINKILIALPDQFFYLASKTQLSDILFFIAKDYMFFQAQEDIESEDYAYNLINFITHLTSDIAKRYYREAGVK